MKTNSNLSILIANYNHGRFIENLLKSINRQSMQPEKIIIIDDGSNDNSHQILSKYIKNDQFKIILNQNNAGVIERMNEGLAYIETEFFMVYGADDLIVRDNAIELSINELKKFPKASLSSSLVFQLNDDYSIKNKVKSPLVSNKTKYFEPNEILKIFTQYGNFINGHMTIIRTKFFLKTINEYPKISMYTDISCFLNLALQHGSIFIPKFLGGYRLQNDGFASKNLMNKRFVYKNFFKMLKLIHNINHKTHNLEKLFKTFKLNTKLYYLKNFRFYEKNDFLSFFKRFFFTVKTNLYFLKESPLFFFYYHLSKIKYLIINIDEKNDIK